MGRHDLRRGALKMGRTRILLAFGALLAAALLAAGCGDNDNGGGGGNLNLITEGTLTIGSDIPYPPFEQGKPPDYKGFDVELMDAIAEKLNLDPKWADTSFGTIFADLQAGKFDIVASATTITPGRSKRVLFSDPYFDSDQALTVQEGSSIQSIDDITSSSTVAVQEGTTGQEYAEQHTDATLQKYPGGVPAFQAVANGQADASLQDLPVSSDATNKFPLEVVETLPTGEQYGFPTQKTNTALADAVNGALKDVIADGTYEEIYKKWFNDEEPPDAYQPSS